MSEATSNQMAQILEEVNYSGPETKLVKCLAAHNEEDWIEFNLRNNYDEFDIIRVVEGAVNGRPGSTDDGHSTDKTLDLIRNFPDPDDKIELYQISRHFKSLEEQKQIFLDVASDGEWLFIVDCDEFYIEGEINRVREAIKSKPTASEIIPTFLHFYRDCSHLKAPHPEWQMQHQRILRYRNGLRYHTHPVATDAQGLCTYFTPAYQAKRFTMQDLYIYHYGHAKGKEFHAMKHEFYKSELEKFKLDDGTNASDKFDEKFVEFMEYSEDLASILVFDGKHPKALAKHPTLKQKESFYEDKEILNWKENFVYKEAELPTIALWMMGPWQKTSPFYNTIKA